MTLGMFTLLPLLKGWEWDLLNTYEWWDVKRGAAPKEQKVEGVGWLASIILQATDIDVLIEIWSRPGQGQGQQLLGNWQPNWFFLSPQAETNLGFAVNHIQPSPTSTAGLFYDVLWAGYGNGALLPFLDQTVVKASLLGTSTQDSCMVSVMMPLIRIKDVEQFVRSLRAVEGTRNMDLAPELIEFAKKYV